MRRKSFQTYKCVGVTFVIFIRRGTVQPLEGLTEEWFLVFLVSGGHHNCCVTLQNKPFSWLLSQYRCAIHHGSLETTGDRKRFV